MVMSALNRHASEAMVAASATAATDVTGFGLIGHLSNLEGGADIDLGSVPLLQGVRQLAEKDLFSGGSRRNHAAYRELVDWHGVSELDQLLLCDAQTSGGLLVAIPPENAARFEKAVPLAARIGTISGSGSIRVRA